MSGEKSKKSGEIGEALTNALLDRIGWKNLMHNIQIDCNTRSHINDKGNPRESHGEDQIFLYNSPFHDDRTDFVHVSDKNVFGSYPKAATLRANFKAHLKELHQTIECAKYNPRLREISSTFGAKKQHYHSGLLVWLHNDDKDIEKNILQELSATRLNIEGDEPFYVVDNARASFLLKVIDDLKRKSVGGKYEFFYPRIGTAITIDEERTGNILPLELIAADIIPAVVQKSGKQELMIYANESFDSDSYKNLIAYSLSFASGLVKTIHIGMPDFNPATDQESADRERLAFHHRTEEITPFSFDRSILDLLQEKE